MLLYLNTPPSLSKTKARFLKQKALSFCILGGVLYWKNAVGILLKCLLEDDAGKIMHELHDGECGGRPTGWPQQTKFLYLVTIGPPFS